MTYYEPPFERGPGALTRTLQLLVRFWYLTVPLTVAGVLAGAGLSTLVPTTYTAEVRLGVGGQTLGAQTIPGFVFASQELAATYARYVDDASVSGRLQEQVGVETAESITEVSASPIPESSIIVIEVQGVDSDDVRQAAQALADALVEQVSGGAQGEDAESALADFQELSTQVAQQEVLVQRLQGELGTLEAQATPALPQTAPIETLRGELAAAQAQQSVLVLRQEEAGDRYRELAGEDAASLSVVREAEVVDDDATVRMLVWGVLGLLAGVGLSLLLATRAARRLRRAPVTDHHLMRVGPRDTTATAPVAYGTQEALGEEEPAVYADEPNHDDPHHPALENPEPVPGAAQPQRYRE